MVTVKLILRPKNGPDLCNFYSKLDILKVLLQTIFLLFFIGFKLLMFRNNVVKISEIFNKWN